MDAEKLLAYIRKAPRINEGDGLIPQARPQSLCIRHGMPISHAIGFNVFCPECSDVRDLATQSKKGDER